jgi:hypothetical protein
MLEENVPHCKGTLPGRILGQADQEHATVRHKFDSRSCEAKEALRREGWSE